MKVSREKPYKKEAKALSDFPGGTVGKNLPASAGDMDLIPGPRSFHMPWSRRSLCTTATEPVFWACKLQPLKPACLEPVLYREAAAMRTLYIATRE